MRLGTLAGEERLLILLISCVCSIYRFHFFFTKNANDLEKTLQVKHAVKVQHKPFKVHKRQQHILFLVLLVFFF